MKKFLVTLTGTICLCLLSQSGYADTNDIEQARLAEKKAGSKSKVKIRLPAPPSCSCTPGPEGPPGPPGPTGCCSCPYCCPDDDADPRSLDDYYTPRSLHPIKVTGATGAMGATGLTGATGAIGATGECQTFATIFIGETGPVEGPDGPVEGSVRVPFDTLGLHSRDIPSDGVNPTLHTLVLPVGIYKLHFQLMMTNTRNPSSSGNTSLFDIDDICLCVDGLGKTENLHMDWTVADRSNTFDEPMTITYSGETLLQIADPGNSSCSFVDISLIIQKDNSSPSIPPIIYFWDPQADNPPKFNSPARLVLTKIAELP